ncbi:polyketide synthase peptide synthetase [Phlyctema vagabunda]|uniref:Polyketide synthase peptide synthetase n=1 Tax=Phlyctema vagabunda TaxID=108571 RepID=A0ABR4PE47_9HELO
MAQCAEPIAIIGSGCRFPGDAQTPSKLWDLLIRPCDLSSRIPSNRFNTAGYYHKEKTYHGSTNVQDAYTLSEDISRFDAQFFNINPVEAEAIDPQHRLLLETVYEGLEAAGQSIDKLQGSSTSVYVGVMNADYSDMVIRDIDTIPQYTATGTARSILSNRISYFFDWHGPSMTIDTACSSSLVALHEAVQSLRSGIASVAVAAGANLIIGPEFFVSTTNLGMLSPNGRSRMWDVGANGYARGDGFAAVILKPLSAALADRDHIECVIRETGVNQDGRTQGITMPSSTAQAALIRDTYARAGLDPLSKKDRCQYFEAHGTGTPAGDPQEASAVSSAFFKSGGKCEEGGDHPLYIGSIKTIIGHTEGTAGLAGVLKASLAMQHGIIPPNMLLEELSPSVKPFYANLCIPTTAVPWPELPAGCPRRASVNSFGFGGTNAHAILESYDATVVPPSVNVRVMVPFTFSAISERSLTGFLTSFSSYLKRTPEIDMQALAWTLSQRSTLPVKIAWSASTPEDLAAQIDERLDASKEGVLVGIRSLGSSKILGIFTGQGAQWPQMGRQLLLQCEVAAQVIVELEKSLQELPESDRPSWSIRDELLKDSSESRLGEAALSQPLCTAVQIMLVELLRSAGVTFEAVVGHSSGEIAAAYVSGFISARDAIRIAYYRGFHAKLARGEYGEKGAMLAVGATLSDAVQFCNAPEFQGRISPAASNSSSSVTLSGDAEAITAAKARFDESKTFARLLKVDTAYHSHHMLPCSDPYVQSLRACGVHTQVPPEGACSWFSSVYHGEKITSRDELKDVYWRDNMVKPVLFSQAIEGAVSRKGFFDLALEIGPHPALKGPATQTLGEVGGGSIPYFGGLSRGYDDISSLSNAIGSLWCNLGPSAIDIASFHTAVTLESRPKLLKGLPTYSWDHNRSYWAESRKSKVIRERNDPVHQLLGRISPDCTDDEIRWSNVLKPKEISWLTGHQLQGQTIFPAAGYIAMALEAAMISYGSNEIQLIEILDFKISRSLPIEDDAAGMETLFTLSTSVATNRDSQAAHFKCYAALQKSSTELALIASGRMVVTYGIPSSAILPVGQTLVLNTVDVDVDRFYDNLLELGYGYNGAFRALTSIRRKIGSASGSIRDPALEDSSPDFLVHPAALDVSIQGVLGAYSYPGDGRLWSLHVPTQIRRIAVNPLLCQSRIKAGSDIRFDTTADNFGPSDVRGEIRLYGKDESHPMIVVEELKLVPLSAAVVSNDCHMFAKTIWDVAMPDAELAIRDCLVREEGKPTYMWIARVVRQIVHRYPHMHILQIGGGSGEVTEMILREPETTFNSFTWTDRSVEAVENANEHFREYSKKMAFKQFDIDSDTSRQNLGTSSYDMIIATGVTNSTGNMRETLKHLRSLLRTGGQLLVQEVVYDQLIRPQRNSSSILSAAHWNTALRAAGFSGIDTIQSSASSSDPSIFTSVATDERMELLRSPLRALLAEPQVEDLVIIGGQKLITAKLVEDIELVLRRWTRQITIVNSLEDLEESTISPMCTVLSLVELDEPTFKSFTSERHAGLRNLFNLARTVVWITQGCREDEPFSNMMVGLGRSLVLEAPHIRLQFVDLKPFERIEPEVLASTLLKFHIFGTWNMNGETADLLWTSEPEIVIENGYTKIPRLIHNVAQNERYNSSKRDILKEVPLSDSVVTVERSGEKFIFRQDENLLLGSQAAEEGKVVVNVSFSLASSIQILPGCYLFLVVGHVPSDETSVIALSTTNSSVITVPESWIFKFDTHSGRKKEALLSASTHILARAISYSIPENSKLLVHEAPIGLVSALQCEASRKSFGVAFTTCESITKDSRYSFIHPQATSREIKRSIPDDVSTFIDISAPNSSLYSRSTVSRIMESLPAMCRVQEPKSMFGCKSLIPNSQFISTSICETIKGIASIDTSSSTWSIADALALGELSHIHAQNLIDVIDWTTTTAVPIKIEPVDSAKLFKKDKTYLLIGLTGGFGLSFCEWMLDHGAKYIVICSRSPRVDTVWLEECQARDAVVKVRALDLGSKKDLLRLYDELTATMPPIAGVANGAMVLRDMPFFNMQHSDFDAVLKPKVNGTIFLDELFTSEKPLDFFILFSSIAAVVGNQGQTAYSAANMFMTALAAQRKCRGLAASVIDVGVIIDNGYTARELSFERQKIMRRELGMWISERDVYQMFAEAIHSGHPQSSEDPEIVSGLHVADQVEATKSNWYNNPRFGFCVQQESDSGLEGFKTSRGPVKAQLLAVSSKDEAFEILKTSFTSKLQDILQLDSDGLGDPELMLESSSYDLGVDSLIAVEVRSWFISELSVDLPILKILGGITVRGMLEEALEKLPGDLFRIKEDQPVAKQDDKKVLLDTHSTNLTSKDPPCNLDDQRTSVTPLSPVNDMTPTSSSVTSSDDFVLVESKVGVPRPAVVRSVEMSYGQLRFWFLGLFLRDPTIFNITMSLKLKGNLRVGDLARAIQVVGQRHEALRTCFFSDSQQKPMQGVIGSSNLRLEEKKISKNSDATEEYEKLKNYVYDVSQAKTMRLILLSQSPTQNYLLVGYHHINMDGKSFAIMLADLEKVYNHQDLPPSLLQYPDFSIRQRNDVKNGKMQNELDYWRQQFPDFPPPLPLFTLSKLSLRQPMQDYGFTRVDLKLDPAFNLKIKTVARTYKTSVYHFFLATLKTLLFRLLDVDDLCIGIADANRVDSDTTNAIGMYLNVLPLRFKSQKGQQFHDSLQDVKSKVHGALLNSTLPFDVLLDELDVPRAATHSPLFQVFADYRAATQLTRTFSDIQLEYNDFSLGKTAYDIVLDIMENSGGETLVMFKLQKYLYSSNDGQILANAFKNLLEAFTENASISLETPSIFPKSDVHTAIEVGRGLHMNSSWPETISHRIDDVTELNSRKIAVKDGVGNCLTYSQMSERVNTIATCLIEKKATGQRVAVFQEPTTDWICSLLAVLRTGAVYVPLDLRNPLTRLAAIVKSSRPSVILADAATVRDAPKLQPGNAAIVDISILNTSTSVKVANRADPESAAIILYTSGSTGTPKGILLKHSSLRNEMEGYTKTWNIGAETVLQQSAFSFDFSLDQIFTALTNGGTVYVVPKSKRGDSVEIAKIIATEGVTYTKATPSEYSSWIRYGADSLKRNSGWVFAFGGGETLNNELKTDFRLLAKPGLRLFNSWGPAEITISATKIEIPYMTDDDHSTDSPPAGLPLPNYSLTIVDRDLNPVPIGVTGEVLVSGAGLAFGYVENNALTSQKFILNTHAPQEYIAEGWTRTYRTGDLGRLRPDGALIFEGRIDGDTQIKLRGLRVELEDIESSILKAAAGTLARTVVSVRGEGEAQYLVAFVEFLHQDDPADGGKEQYLNRLLSRLPLPQYMCPARLISIEQIPLNNHFKIDRLAIKSLPLPPSTESATDSQANLTTTESQLKSVWDEVLTPELTSFFTIDATTDFFHVGGNSMLLVRLQAAIYSFLNIRIPIVELMQNTTLAAMTAKMTAIGLNKTVDWDVVTSLTNLPQLALSETAVDSPTAGITVMLTGSSGHLGRALLRSLIVDKSISHIYAVAARVAFPSPSTKVTILSGDLTLPRLGLSPETFTSLAATVNLIVHNGAKRAFFEAYEQLAPTNVEGTREIIKFAGPRKVPIHFLSSGAIITLAPASVDRLAPDASVSKLRPPTDGSNGYLASKWAGEVLLEHASHEFGIPVCYHRPFGMLASAATTTSVEDVMDDMWTYAKRVKALPLENGWAGHIDFALVDSVAESICSIAGSSHSKQEGKDENGKGKVKIIAHYAERRVEVSAILARILSLAQEATSVGDERVEGKSPSETFECLDMLKWFGRIKAEGFPWLIMGQDVWRELDGVVGVRSVR